MMAMSFSSLFVCFVLLAINMLVRIWLEILLIIARYLPVIDVDAVFWKPFSAAACLH